MAFIDVELIMSKTRAMVAELAFVKAEATLVQGRIDKMVNSKSIGTGQIKKDIVKAQSILNDLLGRVGSLEHELVDTMQVMIDAGERVDQVVGDHHDSMTVAQNWPFTLDAEAMVEAISQATVEVWIEAFKALPLETIQRIEMALNQAKGEQND